MVKRADLARAADPNHYAAGLAAMAPGEHHHSHEIVRTDTYRGHEIVVRTTYVLEIDGETVTADLHVDNNGNVMCHAIPVYRSASMIDLSHRLIDVFPDAFDSNQKPKKVSGGSTSESHHGHGD